MEDVLLELVSRALKGARACFMGVFTSWLRNTLFTVVFRDFGAQKKIQWQDLIRKRVWS